MIKLFRKIFRPVLEPFERDAEKYQTAKWKRWMVLFMSIMALSMAIAVPLVAPADIRAGTWFVPVVFGGFGLVGLIVGLFGSDHAIAKIVGGDKRL